MNATLLPTALFSGLLLAACGEPSSSAAGTDTGGTSGSKETSSSSEPEDLDTSGSTGEDPLQACAVDSPFASQECGKALKDHCRSMPDRQSCSGVEPLVSGSFYAFGCTWASVARFSDSESCEVEKATGRCEAATIEQVGCNDPCELDGAIGLYELNSIVPSKELVRMPCAPSSGVYPGPVGEWTALSYQEEFGAGSVVSSCGTGTNPAPICDCITEACAEW